MSDGGLRQLFARHLPEAHWQPVETWSTGQGVPDVEYCFPGGHTGWIENKLTSGWTVDFRDRTTQVAWLERRARAGGRCFVAVRRRASSGPRRGPAADELWLYRGADARALMVEGLVSGSTSPGPVPLIYGRGGPANWPWLSIKEAITH